MNINKSTVQPLAYYQIGGGGVGMALIANELTNGSVTARAIPVIILACCLFVFSVFCGWLLLKNWKKGLLLSLLNQVLQVVVFVMGRYSYKYAAGVSLLVGINLTEGFTMDFDLELSSFRFAFNSPGSDLIVGVNVIAFYWVYATSRWKEKLEEKELLGKTD